MSSQKTRKLKNKIGGFYPSIMGPFVLNVQAAIVPAALYALYHMVVPKNKSLSKINMPTRKANTRKHRGSGYLTDQQWFNPEVLPPAVGVTNGAHSSYSTPTEIRPVLLSTYSVGGRKRKASRKNRKNSRKASRKNRKNSRKNSRK